MLSDSLLRLALRPRRGASGPGCRGPMPTHRGALFAVALCLCVNTSLAGEARPPFKVGELWLSTPEKAAPYREPFRAGLRDLGYEEGANLILVVRYAGGDPRRIPALV
jgi:hypothetical protein